MKAVDRWMPRLALGYLTLPIITFFLTWLQLTYGLLFSTLLVYGTVWFERRLSGEQYSVGRVALGWRGGLVLALAFVWVFFSGVGSFANQYWDHHFRNAIFRDLIHYDWPTYYSFAVNYKLDLLAGKHPAFNYYFTFWLPAALVGKIGGAQAGNVALLLWSYAGVLLVLYYLNRLFGFRSVLTVSLLFIAWGGLDLLGKIVLQKHVPIYEEFIETYAPYFFTSFTTDLNHVFHQTIPTWLVTLFVLNYWQRVPLAPALLLLAYAPFPFIGLALFWASYYLSGQLAAGKSVSGLVRQAATDLLTAGNLAVLLAVFVPYAFFYAAHTETVPSSFYWTRYNQHNTVEDLKQVIIYGATYFFEAGVYLGLIWFISPPTYRANRLLFWLCAGWLLLIPAWSVGLNNDFASRASIPALTVLCLLTIRALFEAYERRPTSYRLVAALGVLVISWVTPSLTFIQSVPFDRKPALCESLVTFGNPAVTPNNDPLGIYPNLGFYYVFDPQTHFFYKHLVRK